MARPLWIMVATCSVAACTSTTRGVPGSDAGADASSGAGGGAGSSASGAAGIAGDAAGGGAGTSASGAAGASGSGGSSGASGGSGGVSDGSAGAGGSAGAVADATVDATPDAPKLVCDPRFTLPNQVVAGIEFTIQFEDTLGHVNVDLQFTGPGSATWTFGSAIGAPPMVVWTLPATVTAPGQYEVTFLRDVTDASPGVVVATCEFLAE